LPCGTYVLKTEEPIEFEGRKYSWNLKVNLAHGMPNQLELSVDNATTEKIIRQASVTGGRVTDDLGVFFKKYEPSVVTVWRAPPGRPVGAKMMAVADSAGAPGISTRADGSRKLPQLGNLLRERCPVERDVGFP